MSAFSRGCFVRHHILHTTCNMHVFLPSKSSHQPRFLSSTSILRAVTRTAPTTPLARSLPRSNPSFTPTRSPTPSQPAIYQTYASKLALKHHPTLLYQAPSHTGFIIGSYIGAGFCFSWATFMFWSYYLNPPEGLPSWVPIAYGGVCFMMAGAGGYFLLGPAWIVKSITAMPHSALKAAGAVAKGAAPEELKIEIELRRMFPLPFMPARKLYVKPEEIRLDHQLARVDAKPTAAQMKAIRLQEAEEARKALEYEQTHLLSKGPRMVSRGAFDLFKGIRRTWTKEGFAKIWIKGYRYKLDVSGGWALDGGRALDRLVTIKPNL